jgi:hypothetical protein
MLSTPSGEPRFKVTLLARPFLSSLMQNMSTTLGLGRSHDTCLPYLSVPHFLFVCLLLSLESLRFSPRKYLRNLTWINYNRNYSLINMYDCLHNGSYDIFYYSVFLLFVFQKIVTLFVDHLRFLGPNVGRVDRLRNSAVRGIYSNALFKTPPVSRNISILFAVQLSLMLQT